MANSCKVFSTLIAIFAVVAIVAGVSADPVENEGQKVVADEQKLEPEFVWTLDHTNYSDVISRHKMIVVEFYAPWCGYCQQLAPKYEEAASVLSSHDPPVILAKMDTTVPENADLARNYTHNGVPSIKIFRNGGKTVHDYKGTRETDGIISYLKKHAGPASLEIKSKEDAASLIDEKKIVVVGIFPELSLEKIKNFTALAEDLRVDYDFVHTLDAKFLPHGGPVDKPTIRLLKPFDELYADFEDFQVEAMQNFIEETSVPIMAILDDKPENQAFVSHFLHSPGDKVFLFLNFTMDLDHFKSKYYDLAASYKGKEANFLLGDAETGKRALEYFGLNTDQVPLIFVLAMDGTKYVQRHVQPDSLAAWLKDFNDGKLKPYLKSQPIPEVNNEPVKMVVAETLEDMVFKSGKDVLLEFYRLGCKYCEEFAPVLDEIALSFENDADVLIAKIDGTENDIPRVTKCKESKKMPFLSKIERQSDYSSFSSSCPIVIDNGASYFRIGWAGENDPRVIFRNIVQRPRHKTTGETVTVVGDHNPALLKYFDCTRSGPRSAFESNVVYQFEIMEYILDFGFDRLGADQSQIDHPILITECACNPVQSRGKMAELLFESYGVPSVAFGVDAAFSYKYNQQLGICKDIGLAISSGFTTSHVIPFINGEPVYEACCRTNVGGYHVTDYLKQLLSLKHPHHISKLTWEKVEELKMEYCYIAADYASKVQLFQRGDKEAEEKTRCWQLPWTPSPADEPPSEEELARKAALKEKQSQRLREMAEVKRSSKINELENELKGLEFLLEELKDTEDDQIVSFLASRGYASKREVEAAFAKVTQTLRKAKGEQVPSDEKADASAAEKYYLIDIPDEELSAEQLKEKRRQVFLKSTTEARQRAKQKRLEEELEKEKEKKLEEQRRLENPERYMEQLRAKYKELSEKLEQRKRLKTNGNHANGNNNVSGGVGRGERLNAAQRERMRLLTTAAFDRGKGEDTFGQRDEDWQLYKLMSRDNDDDDDDKPDQDETELARISSRLQEIDPSFFPGSESGASASEVPRFRPLTKEDFQIILGVERFRCPEVLFNPNLIGTDQSGLDEMAGVSLRRLPTWGQGLGDKMTTSILMTGGSCLYPGMAERLEAGIRMIRPCGTPIKVLRATDPIMDAWRGASTYAAAMQFPQQTFSRMDYYEKGEDWLRRYKFRYRI